MDSKYNPIDDVFVRKYLERLVDKIYKLLPMQEKNNPTLTIYHRSLMLELTGFSSLFNCLRENSELVSLISSLESLLFIVNDYDMFRRKVFECINLAKKIK